MVCRLQFPHPVMELEKSTGNRRKLASVPTICQPILITSLESWFLETVLLIIFMTEKQYYVSAQKTT